MSRGRVVLLAGCALGLGTLAASDMAARERALRSQVGGLVPVVVAARELPAGHRIAAADLRVRTVPERWAPRERYPQPQALVGISTSAPVAEGSDLARPMLQGGDGDSPVRRGERVAQVTGRGTAALIVPGTRVDVVVTGDRGEDGSARLVLQDAEVLSSSAAPRDDQRGGGERVAVSLRATAAQAVALAKAEDFAREVRILPRAPGDRATVR